MNKPERINKDNYFGQPEYKYIEDMLKYLEDNDMEIDLKDFTHSEIQATPVLYEKYLSKFKE